MQASPLILALLITVTLVNTGVQLFTYIVGSLNPTEATFIGCHVILNKLKSSMLESQNSPLFQLSHTRSCRNTLYTEQHAKIGIRVTSTRNQCLLYLVPKNWNQSVLWSHLIIKIHGKTI